MGAPGFRNTAALNGVIRLPVAAGAERSGSGRTHNAAASCPSLPLGVSRDPPHAGSARPHAASPAYLLPLSSQIGTFSRSPRLENHRLVLVEVRVTPQVACLETRKPWII